MRIRRQDFCFAKILPASIVLLKFCKIKNPRAMRAGVQ
jgi:hypothetical protein